MQIPKLRGRLPLRPQSASRTQERTITLARLVPVLVLGERQARHTGQVHVVPAKRSSDACAQNGIERAGSKLNVLVTKSLSPELERIGLGFPERYRHTEPRGEDPRFTFVREMESDQRIGDPEQRLVAMMILGLVGNKRLAI